MSLAGYLQRRRRPGSSIAESPDFDLALVVAPQNRGWILEGICRELADRTAGSHVFHYGDGPLPEARCYFFSHFSLFFGHMADVSKRCSLVWYTHPAYASSEARGVAKRLRAATRVIVHSGLHRQGLLAAGLPAARISVVPPGADPQRFLPHRRGDGAIGLCSAFYPRKAPERVLELVRTMRHREFRLLGRNWEQWPRFPELCRLPNFSYREAAYGSYPSFYDGIDVFLSPSRLEGGPVPLLEAMMANAVPVATRTGFAADLIAHGRNGFLCDTDAPTATFVGLLEAAYDLDADVRATVAHHTWDAFAAAILGLAGMPTRLPVPAAGPSATVPGGTFEVRPGTAEPAE